MSINASYFADYRIGDTLFVYTSNEKAFAEGALRYQGQDNTSGIVSKMERYLVKGSYFLIMVPTMLTGEM